MKYFESPEFFDGKTMRDERTIFIAGGITGCPDFQKEFRGMFLSEVSSEEEMESCRRITLFNPRRENFPIHDPNAAKWQIWWERVHLMIADEILFWFPKETLCPIVLYELGHWSASKKKLYVGVHPEYQRKQDVEIQTRYCRPDVNIVYSLEDLYEQVTEGGF